MSTRTLLSIAAVVGLIFALALLLMPAFMGTLYGLGANPVQTLLARYFGVTLLGVGLINWLAKDMDYASLRPILLGNLVADFVGILVSLMGTLSGVMNSMGWSSVVIYLLLTLGFAYVVFMSQPANVKQRV